MVGYISDWSDSRRRHSGSIFVCVLTESPTAGSSLGAVA
jgi:hypothetical protein